VKISSAAAAQHLANSFMSRSSRAAVYPTRWSRAQARFTK
jgi:hypothetical protein